jgi:NADPH:quinone reductase-like Zn-dependent oxidoreductase
MRAVAITEFGGPDRLQVLDLPEPLVGPDTVRLRVRAAGVDPVDHKMRQGNLAGRFPHFFPLILGWDAAGVVEFVGPADAGALRVHLSQVVPLEEAARAHEQLETGHTRGKVVLRV